MKITGSNAVSLASALLLLTTACGDDGPKATSTTFNTFSPSSDPNEPDAMSDPSNSDPTTDGPTTTGPTTDGPTTTGPTTTGPTTNEPTTNGPTTNGPTTTDATTTDPTATTDPDPSTDGTGGDQGFVFADDPYDAYVQIDRHGAVEAGTAAIRGSEGLGFMPGDNIDIRDDYNASNPAEDAMGAWIPEIQQSLVFFHDALDDDLISIGVVPATINESIMQAGPVIIPDTIKYDPSKPTAYPNGRKLQDRVVDITLAAVLIKLGPDQPVTLFADIPLNPGANDVAFKNTFPFLAAPH
jgi:hypothetical protein